MDNQEDSRQRSRGRINVPTPGIGTIRTGVQVARIVAGFGSTFWIIIGVVVGVSFFTLVLTTATTGEAAPIPGGTDQNAGQNASAVNNPIVISGTGEACVARYEGHNDCSVGHLLNSLGGDRSKAIIASLICESESGSNPYHPNKDCTSGDYSIGLFQINAVYNCPGAYAYTNPPSQACFTLIDSQQRDICENDWSNNSGNIEMMLKLSSGGKNWDNWSTWFVPGKIGIAVKDLLSRCGIST